MKITGKCKCCGGTLEFQRCDVKRIYVRCNNCGFRTYYPFRDEEEANRYVQTANREILDRVRKGLVDWEMVQWDQLHEDIVRFINTHPYIANDIRFQMAKIACITRGFHIMDDEIFQRCQTKFIVTEEIYKGLMNLRKAQIKAPRLFSDLEDYEHARVNYLYLKTEYQTAKAAKKIAKIVLQKVARPWLPF